MTFLTRILGTTYAWLQMIMYHADLIFRQNVYDNIFPIIKPKHCIPVSNCVNSATLIRRPQEETKQLARVFKYCGLTSLLPRSKGKTLTTIKHLKNPNIVAPKALKTWSYLKKSNIIKIHRGKTRSCLLQLRWCKRLCYTFNSLRPSDAYMRQQTNHHWFR